MGHSYACHSHNKATRQVCKYPIDALTHSPLPAIFLSRKRLALVLGAHAQPHILLSVSKELEVFFSCLRLLEPPPCMPIVPMHSSPRKLVVAAAVAAAAVVQCAAVDLGSEYELMARSIQ